MARVHTHYDNLKVARNAPPEVIRAAYKSLSQKYHPDRNPNKPDAIRIIKIINSAYEVLSDPQKRREHDEWIAREEVVLASKTDAGSSFNSKRNAERQSESVRPRYNDVHQSQQSQKRTFKPWDFIIHPLRLILGRFSKFIFRKA